MLQDLKVLGQLAAKAIGMRIDHPGNSDECMMWHIGMLQVGILGVALMAANKLRPSRRKPRGNS